MRRFQLRTRLTTLAFIVGYTVLNSMSCCCIIIWLYKAHRILHEASPIGRCELANRIAIIFETLSIPCSQLLLLLHVRAVHINNQRLVYFFVSLWLCTAATSIIAPIIAAYSTSPFSDIGPTKYCIGTPVRAYVGATVIAPMLNDFVLFLALAWRLRESAYIDERRGTTSFKSTILGGHLPILSRALFLNGQAYFLWVILRCVVIRSTNLTAPLLRHRTTVVVDITTVTLFYTESVPPPYRYILGCPDIVVMNIMASRIYRNINSGISTRTTTPQSSENSKSLATICNRQHVEEISLNQTPSLAGTSMTSGRVQLCLTNHGEFPKFVGAQDV